MVEVKNLKKIYRTESDTVEALKGINLVLNKGEFALIMGASGSGKSTLLHVLGTLDRPTSGKVFYKGKDLFSMNEKKLALFRNKNLGFVFQFHYLIMEFTLIENVMAPLLIAGVDVDEAREKAVDMLKKVGLGHRLTHKPFEISGGEQQRTAIARALVNSPELVLADEPTGNLDSKTSESVLSLMAELNRETETTFFIATHNRELEKFADRIYFIKDGIINI
ncbi:ABC transporter ATP-binding protein [Desulfurobacterium indicum]|uniref:ABC transporter ATP-binding protein n=1 Tax=Desulfurobacterium indicum TaxID=1914305 RepID=A0A1R1MMJ2_9BACT|nr:ABC transporter ATP-binding protein [Desulfurobacterium indicum]